MLATILTALSIAFSLASIALLVKNQIEYERYKVQWRKEWQDMQDAIDALKDSPVE